MNDLSRRNMLRAAGLGGLGLTGLLAACGGGDSTTAKATATSTSTASPASLKVALGWIKNVEFAGFWVADDRGYYAEENLDVTFLSGGPNTPDPTTSVSSDAADIGVHPAMQSVIEAIPKGNDFVVLGTQFQTSPGGLLSLASDPVTTAKDLIGAKILGQQGVQATLDAVFARNGLKKDYSFVPVGYDPSPLVKKQGKAYTCFVTNQPITLEETSGMKQGKDYVTVTYADLGLPLYSNLVFVKRAMLDDKADVLQRFMRATIRGFQDNAEDPAAAAKLAVEKYGADLGLQLKQQTRENELQLPLMESDLTKAKGLFRIDQDLFAGDMFDALKASGVAKLPDAEKVVDHAVLDGVFGGKSVI
jgi:ABC-type nitrate/sulfonate/bicarbonate transport system substrate-binding protein